MDNYSFILKSTLEKVFCLNYKNTKYFSEELYIFLFILLFFFLNEVNDQMNWMIKNTSNPHHYNRCGMLVASSLKNMWFWLQSKAHTVLCINKNYNTYQWTFKYQILTDNINICWQILIKNHWCHNNIFCIPKYHGVFLLQIKVSFKLSCGTGFLLCSV